MVPGACASLVCGSILFVACVTPPTPRPHSTNPTYARGRSEFEARNWSAVHIVYTPTSPALQGYKFTVKSEHRFDVVAGKARQIGVILYERGSPLTPLGERPAVDFPDESP